MRGLFRQGGRLLALATFGVLLTCTLAGALSQRLDLEMD